MDTGKLSLDQVPLLASLSQAERDDLVKQCRWKRYGPGEQIIDSQTDSREVFFVIKGTVRVMNFSVSGREVTLDDVPPGGHFGELAAIDGGPRSASVLAQGDAVTAALPHDAFVATLSRHPEIAMTIMKHLARLIRQSTDRIMDLSTLGANNRVHAELLRQGKLFTKDGETAVISPIPLHSDIASRVSTTRETVARVLSDLSREGIVRRDKDALVVTDLGHLERLVEDVRGV